ncbi:MAG: ABC transporter ATP-binding protein [Deltaproteobacteria bacterium]|nr:ABC transporter ATP-binding protein [Deltaproteobacteria bacterium]
MGTDASSAGTTPGGRALGLHRVSRIARNVRATVRLAWAAAPRQIVGVVAITIVYGLISPVTLWFTKLTIDAIAAKPTMWNEPQLLWPVLGLGAMAVVNKALGSFVDRLQDLFSDRVWMVAHRRFLLHVANADLGLLDDPTWHDRLTRAKADVAWRPYNLTITLIHMLSSTITVVTLLAALLFLDPPLLALGVLSVIPHTVMRLRVNKRFYALFWTTTRREREHDYLVDVASDARFAKDLRAFGLADHVVERAKSHSADRLEHKRRLYRDANRGDFLGSMISAAVLVVAYLLIARGATGGRLTVGDVAAIFGAFTALTGQLGALLQSVARIDEHASFLDDYFGFLAIEPSVRAPAAPRALPERLTSVQLERVGFAYPGQSADVLSDIDLELRTGQIVALVGENGAGKSTLVKLLLRFFDPTRGAVRIDGVDARELDPAALRRRVGVLFQDFGIFELEVKDMVGFGRIDAPFDAERAAAALRKARADELVRSLGKGLDSVVGRVLEGGHDLSGGQWQRLALARLIYRDADLWILDEPTANLDANVEAEVFTELRGLLQGRMGVIISHRFSTVRGADQILVLEQGRVLERGTHDELMALGGRYAAMFTLQASGYR